MRLAVVKLICLAPLQQLHVAALVTQKPQAPHLTPPHVVFHVAAMAIALDIAQTFTAGAGSFGGKEGDGIRELVACPGPSEPYILNDPFFSFGIDVPAKQQLWINGSFVDHHLTNCYDARQ